MSSNNTTDDEQQALLSRKTHADSHRQRKQRRRTALFLGGSLILAVWFVYHLWQTTRLHNFKSKFRHVHTPQALYQLLRTVQPARRSPMDAVVAQQAPAFVTRDGVGVFMLSSSVPMTCDTLRTATLLGYPANVIQDIPTLRHTKGTIKDIKLDTLLSVASYLPPDTIIVWVDAFDVRFVRSMSSLKKTFLEYEAKTGHSVMLGAETKCWPFYWEGHLGCPLLHPTESLSLDIVTALYDAMRPHEFPSYLYVNSGVCVGRAGELRKLLAVGVVVRDKLLEQQCLDDQLVTTLAFLANISATGLDVRGSVFHNVLQTRLTVRYPRQVSTAMLKSTSSPPFSPVFLSGGVPLIYDPLTRVYPHVLHFNGIKEPMDHWYGIAGFPEAVWRYHRYAAMAAREEAQTSSASPRWDTVSVWGRRAQLHELCPAPTYTAEVDDPWGPKLFDTDLDLDL